MTDEELIARLRDEHVAASRTEAADRIEALTAKVKLMDDLDAINGEKIEALTAELNTCRMAQVVMDNTVAELEAKLAQAVEALEQIARPKVGPDFDWTEDETNKWRAVWYRKYQDIALATLAEIKGESYE